MKEFKLLIDPGHGGSNHGVMANGILEKVYTMELANILHGSLEGNGWYNVIDVEMTRYADETVSWADRIRSANDLNADLVLAIHVNGAENPKAHGSRVFVWPGTAAYWPAKIMATRSPRRLEAGYNSAEPIEVARASYPDAYALIARYPQPVLLYEMGFATNELDAELLNRKSTQLALAAAMLAGIAEAVEWKREQQSGGST